MQQFYKKALCAFILIVLADALLSALLVGRSYLALPLLAGEGGGVHWQRTQNQGSMNLDPWVLRLDPSAGDRLRFDLNLRPDEPDPRVSADLVARDDSGRLALVDLSAYDTITFVARCKPASPLLFIMSLHHEQVSQSGNFLSYAPAMVNFPCNEAGAPVTLDLRRMTIPNWWFDGFKVDVSYQNYALDRVARFAIGATRQTPRGTVAHVDISGITVRGRDYRYLGALALLVAGGWIAYGIWFFRAQWRAMSENLNTHMKKDLPLVAYRQLTLEPHRDKEKAKLLQYIATNYTNPELDLEGVVAATGTNRTKINDVLKSELGLTFTSYLHKLRLTEAARLLTEFADRPVAEIAFMVGYANVSYFNKLFKEEYGCTPKAFRALAAQGEQPVSPAQETVTQ
jgi:AraC-like DNA-binding protein